jgi:hypothetical protein
MLTRANIDQIFEEHEVFDRDREAKEHHLLVVELTIGLERGNVLGRASRLEDGGFVSLAICVPLWKQNPSYTELMQSRRREWFGYTEENQARVSGFLLCPELYRLDVYELGSVIDARDPLGAVEEYLGSLPALDY